MSTKTTIEWTKNDDGSAGRTWNVVSGCDKLSSGCDHCYAENIARRFAGSKAFPNGFAVTMHPERLLDPLKWRKPTRVFVNSMSDMFHADIPDELIAQMFAVMAATPQHTYQILSKRHGRMRSLLNSLEFKHLVAREIDALAVEADHDSAERWRPIPEFGGYEASTHGRIRGARGILAPSVNPVTGRDAVTLWRSNVPKTMPVHRLILLAHAPTEDATLEACHRNGDKTDNRLANLRGGSRSENQREKIRHGSRGGPQKLTPAQAEEIRSLRKQGLTQQAIADQYGISRSLVSLIENGLAWSEPDITWPLPNVHLGVSCEDQRWADIRIPALLATPAAVRFLSCEPLLGPIDLIGDVHAGHEWEDDFGQPVCLTCSTEETSVAYFEREHLIPGLSWVIAGAESGPGARSMDLDWVRSLRDQCVKADVAFFFKQDAVNGKKVPTPELDGRVWVEMPRVPEAVAAR